MQFADRRQHRATHHTKDRFLLTAAEPCPDLQSVLEMTFRNRGVGLRCNSVVEPIPTRPWVQVQHRKTMKDAYRSKCHKHEKEV